MREGYEWAELVGGYVDGQQRQVKPAWNQINVMSPPWSWTYEQAPENGWHEPDVLVYYRVHQRRADGVARFVWSRLLHAAAA